MPDSETTRPGRVGEPNPDATSRARPDPTAPGDNWARNYRYRAQRVHHPRSVDELQRLIRSTDRIRPLGSRHSFNDIADSDGDLVALDAMPGTVDIDAAAGTATVSAGLPYSTVAERLSAAGFALPAMASLPHISVAGACATGTHGSGDRAGGLGTAVIAVGFVDGRGELVRVSKSEHPESFPGTVVGLGALGVLTDLTLSLQPYYQVAQSVFLGLPAAALIEGFDRIYRTGDSVSCFTRWQRDTVDQVWIKRRIVDTGGDGAVRNGCDDGDPRLPDTLAGARPAPGQLSPIPGGNPSNCTQQGGVPGPWHDRLPHFRAGHRPSVGDEIQSEYFVARSQAPAAIRALFAMGEAMTDVLRVAEVRTIAADDLWLSPAYQQHTVALHFTWTSDAAAVSRVLRVLEETLAPFGAVPHWGKVFTAGPDAFRRRYRRLPDFRDLVRRHDPDGRFGNEFLSRYLLGTG